MEWQDEQNVLAALKRGDIEEAKRVAFTFAPPESLEPVDPKKKKIKKPVISPAHLRSRAQVYGAMGDWDAALKDAKGTSLVFVNSVCGCAAGNARPALKILMSGSTKPERAFTVFAGQDREATDKARAYFVGQPPSSPCFVLLKDGAVVGMLHRHDIEGRMAPDIAADLEEAVKAHAGDR